MQAGPLPLRRKPATFASLANIITSQQVSVASAAAIFKRLEEHFGPGGITAQAIRDSSDEELASLGQSRPKIRTLRAVADACISGLDLGALANEPADIAHARLCEIKGIGRWSADIYLLFCAGHPDVFPSGDLALQVAVKMAFELPDRPTIKELDARAADWAPVRGIAARLFWAWYKVHKQGKETLPL
ncbi:MAG: DNA-3-methyladenine glycosylase 2 family protein [Rhodobacteraceae bacterium]|nr:DNA-3-methyladenine glycosylase 2 family protein [Paracoccaceae bacterium]